MRASASATVASGGSTTGSVVIMPPAVRSSYVEQPAQVLGVVGLHQARAAARPVSGGSSASRSAASSGLHLLEDVGGALLLELAEDLDLVVLGQLLEDVGEPLVVQRCARPRPGAWRTARAARWPGRRGAAARTSRAGSSAPCSVARASGQAGHVVPVDVQRLAAAAEAAAGPCGRRPGHRQSRVRSLLDGDVQHRDRARRSRAASRGRSSSSPRTSVSRGRCSKRRRLTRPGDDLPDVDRRSPGSSAGRSGAAAAPRRPGRARAAAGRCAAPRRGRAPCRPGRRRVEHGDAGQVRDEDPRTRPGRHTGRLAPEPAFRRRGGSCTRDGHWSSVPRARPPAPVDARERSHGR